MIRDVGDVSMHWEGAGLLSPTGDTPNDGAAAKTTSRWGLVLPCTGDGNGRGGIGGGGNIRHQPPEHHHIVHRDQTHHGYVSIIGVASWGVGVPLVVGTGELGYEGDAGGGNVSRNGGDGGGGGRGEILIIRQRGIFLRLIY